MEATHFKIVLLVFLGAAFAILGLLLSLQRKRGHKASRNYYIEALHALIEQRTDDALQLLMSAVRMGETSTDAYLQLGKLLGEKGQYERALQVHKSLMVRRDLSDDEQKSVIVAIAEDFDGLGRTAKAIQTLENLSRRSKDPDIQLSLHKLHHRSGDYEKAFSCLRNVSRIDKSYERSMLAGYLASVAYDLIRAGERSEAGKFLERARKEYRNAASALYVSGRLAMHEDDLSEAAKQWQRLLETDIRYFDEVLPSLQKSLYESGRFQDLEKILTGLIERHPDEHSIPLALSSFYEKMGEKETAISILEEDASPGSNDPIAAARLASLYLQRGEDESALRILDSIGVNSDEPVLYQCKVCSHIADAPLSYCNSCSSFNTFTKDYEKISE